MRSSPSALQATLDAAKNAVARNAVISAALDTLIRVRSVRLLMSTASRRLDYLLQASQSFPAAAPQLCNITNCVNLDNIIL